MEKVWGGFPGAQTRVLNLLLLFVGSPGLAAQAPSAALGKQLFESPAPGNNGKSCSSCHPQGKGLKKIAGYDEAKLKGMINSCIRSALKGEARP